MIHLIAVFEAARVHKLDPHLKAAGLTTPAIRALAWIKASPGATMSELAAGVFTDRTTLTRTVDMLVREDMVHRLGDATDRRKVTLTLTEKGDDVCRMGHDLIDEISASIGGLVEPDVLRQMNRALLKLHKVFVDDPRIRDIHTGRAMPPPAADAPAGKDDRA
ncbi:MarR family winged helix-turn-helix transcriptional regulator [Caulobacter sp. KR2-114]|uniref:MarR family winged helix-turn-helix transcriptional regulator n=1 Tax=Caulobacter sp. KR2-114 TaxID=3400912 RepID=UPI003C0D7448